jgi:DNA-binding NarL/FixJ family response regulator
LSWEIAVFVALLDGVARAGARIGDGLDLIRWFRPKWPTLPLAVITGGLTAHAINAPCRLDAAFPAKPIDAEAISCFLDRIGQPIHRVIVAVERAFERARERYELADREYEIVRWVDAGNEVGAFAEHAAISENTVKDYVKRLLAKTDGPNVKALASRIRGEAWSNHDAMGAASARISEPRIGIGERSAATHRSPEEDDGD